MAERDGGLRTPRGGDALRPARQKSSDPAAPRHQPAAPDRAGSGPGNQALQRMLRRRDVQAKLTVNPPDDVYEREADRVADRVLSSPAPGSAAGGVSAAPPAVSRIQRADAAAAAQEMAPPEEEDKKRRVEEMKAAEEEEKAAAEAAQEEPPAPDSAAAAEEEAAAEEKKKDEETPEEAVQTKRAPSGRTSAAAVPRVAPELESRLAHPESGRPLPVDLRRFFEPRFGRDLSGVRLHTDGAAARDAGELDAHAFTRGRHVYFAAGAYRPETAAGRRLLAHELVHTQQQAPSPPLRRDAAAEADGANAPAGRADRDRPAATAGVSGNAAGAPVSRAEPSIAEPASSPVAVPPTAAPPCAGPSTAAPPIATPAPATTLAGSAAGPPAAACAVTPLQRSAVQRAEGDAPQPDAAGGDSEGGAVDPSTLPLETGRLDTTSETITFSELEVPGFKLEGHRGALYNSRKLRQKKAYNRGNPDQRSVWKQQLGGDTQAVVTKLQGKLDAAHGGQPPKEGTQPVFQGKTGKGAPRYFIGDLPTVARELTLPTWTASGSPHDYDVDHIVELQLANWDADGWANTLDNMELLDSSTNRSSGSTVKGAIDKKVESFIKATDGAYGKGVATVKSQYNLEFNQPKGGGGGGKVEEKEGYWTAAHIRAGDQVEPVQVANESALGGDGKVVVFPDAAGGQPKQFSDSGKLSKADRDWLKPYQIQEASFNVEEGAETSDSLGSITFVMPEGHAKYQPSGEGPITIPVGRIPGARYAGFIDKTAVRRQLTKLRVKGASPVEIFDFDVTPAGLLATGQILPDVPLLEGSGIDFELLGDDLTFSKTFAGPELKAPKPFEVKESELTVSAGTRGAKVEGQASFAIENVGEGFLRALKGTHEDFALEGSFDFDSELFDPAKLTAKYEAGKLSASGDVGVPAGKVKGVKKASLSVTYSEEEGRLAASGDAELAIPGVDKGSLNVEYVEGQGLTLGGSFDLTGDVPGIKGGKVEAKLEKAAGGGEWKLSASGNAQPDVPGFDTQLSASYDDGVFDLSAKAAYGRGMASGTVQVGVTNKAVDETGQPTGEAGEALTLYGGGSVTLTLAPWLQATAGLRLLPDGSMEVSGDIGLPSALQLFEEMKYEKNIFRVGLDIPIVGVAVAGQRIGIFATVSGGLDLSAGIGPGELKDLHLGITYNPEHEEDTRITGDAEVQVPAHAGLRLSIRGGLGAGIPIVSATAALEVGGALGLEGLARAGVHLDWTPDQGLVIDADGEIKVEPKFVFDVTGMVLVEADLWIDTIELYSQRWKLASFEWGPGLSFGIRFPIHYEDKQPFSLDWSQVEFDVPDVDTDQILAGLMDQIA